MLSRIRVQFEIELIARLLEKSETVLEIRKGASDRITPTNSTDIL